MFLAITAYTPIKKLARTLNYHVAEAMRVQIKGKYSDGDLASHNCRTSLTFGIASSRWEIHWNFCMILFPALIGSTFAWSRDCNLFIRPRVSLATESLRPANKSETATP